MEKANYLSYPALVCLPGQYDNLRKRVDERNYWIHRKSIDTVKPMVDDKPPRTYLHFHMNRKKIQVEHEKITDIERGNRMLLEKIAYILRTRGRVDHWNDYQSKSLNSGKRHRELIKIALENQAILRRINSSKSHYMHHCFEDEFKISRKYIENISRFPSFQKNQNRLPPAAFSI
ncbi:sperm axonemal maintenance protein CFAP97D1 [Latimeria chalumnae]|uniref:CFAP97 domain containing 1 n=1 Tax=Latimeria chalumnae TaxID=7897 RepID=M3XI85_LATCH|nr:PREDICTED: uncharacterized protein C17orf105 homolog isoform X2 [Latimeria chalumnae]|eukprot:XP_014346782.1 PREDICTED: uncharacterized protein C17orf105 homolog isoform X2 [Latimeria chalumnae]